MTIFQQNLLNNSKSLLSTLLCTAFFKTILKKRIAHSLLSLGITFLCAAHNPLTAQNWNQIIKAAASDRAASDNFGYSVAISGDYAIVGAFSEDENAAGGAMLTQAGSAYFFKREVFEKVDTYFT